MEKRYIESQSPFGFWGDRNLIEKFEMVMAGCRHNRLSAFGVIGTYTLPSSSESVYL